VKYKVQYTFLSAGMF